MTMTNHSPDALLHKDRICSYLKLNSTAHKPIVSRKLQGLWNISDLTVRQAVALLRDDGMPIASGSKGFYSAKTAGELEDTINHLRERVIGISKRISSLTSTQNKMRHDGNGQGLLFTGLEDDE